MRTWPARSSATRDLADGDGFGYGPNKMSFKRVEPASAGAGPTSSRRQSPIFTFKNRGTGRRSRSSTTARADHKLAGRDTEPRDRRRRARGTRSGTYLARPARARRLPLLPRNASRPAPTPRRRQRGTRRIRTRPRAHPTGTGTALPRIPARRPPGQRQITRRSGAQTRHQAFLCPVAGLELTVRCLEVRMMKPLVQNRDRRPCQRRELGELEIVS